VNNCHRRTNAALFHLYQSSKTGRFIESKSKEMMAARNEKNEELLIQSHEIKQERNLT
jgi:hypothetical protein